ncbi:MAG: hypothetical protein CMJ19_21855 [Phycisphaeraceae bacterium]|nr:hypothetical protein [Phycisphaeraceae bacterium]
MIKAKTKHYISGFTLMELIVSIAIVSMMLFLVNRIFFDTSEAVSRGIATSKIIANTRTIGEQIAEDFELMQPPDSTPGNNAGFLIITQQEYTAQYLDGRDADGIRQAGRTVRSDQLCFIRSRNGATPITNTDTTSNSFTGSFDPLNLPDYCRVWYGHLRQYPESGIPTHTLGDTGTPDTYATNWVLGRQLLFLDGSQPGNAYCVYGTSAPWTVATRGFFYLGFSDVLKKDLRNGTSTGLLDDLEPTFPTTITRSDYKDLLYGPNRFYVFPDNYRLAVRTTPTLSQLSASEIAQMHPYFINNVSDFIVEFAGDYESPAGLDMDGSNNIKWYDLDTELPMASSEPFEIDGGTDPNADVANNTNPYLARGSGAAATDTARTIIFFHNDANYWPQLLRIRYRLHDPKGELMGLDETGTTTEPGKWFEIIVKVPN